MQVLRVKDLLMALFGSSIKESEDAKWSNLKEKGMDTEDQVDHYLESIRNKGFLGETFPIYWPIFLVFSP